MMLRLLKHHQHAGEMLAPGTQITVTDTVAQWLMNNGVAEPWLGTTGEVRIARVTPERAAPTAGTLALPKPRRCCGW